MHGKKLLFLLSFGALAFTVSSTVASRNASFDNYSVRDKEIIVLFKEGSGINDFKRELNQISDDYSIVKTYDGIANGVMINANNSFLNVLSSLPSVDVAKENKVIASLTTRVEYDGSKVFTNPLDNNSVEDMNVPSTSNGGEGTLIAVLDSSFTLGHEAFTDLGSDVEKKLTKEEVENFVQNGDLKAEGLGTNSDNYYFNSKIPYFHDYGGTVTDTKTGDHTEDNDVETKLSEHGMHVSSIATANGKFKGVAPNAQLAFMKVFGDYVSGSSGTQLCTDDMVVSALNDAEKLGADVINLSLGSDLDEFYDAASYTVFERLQKEGIQVSAAAGNEGKGTWRVSGVYQYDTTALVEDGVIGSYSNSPFVTGVSAAVTTDDTTASSVVSEIGFAGQTLYGEDQYINVTGSDITYTEEHRFLDLIPDGQRSIKLEYVLVPGVGSINNQDTSTGADCGDDYAGIDVKGKIAIVKRGKINFTDKVLNAKKKGALGIIICNDTGLGDVGRFDLSSLPASSAIPVYSANTGTYEKLAAVAEGKRELTITKSQMADFSSDGATADLRFGTEITTPGLNIAGAVNVDGNGQNITNGYAYLSGTSMATPNYTGAVSLILGEQEFATPEEELAYKLTIEQRTMTTAHPVMQANGSPVSVRKQGAGLIDVTSAAYSPVYLEGDEGQGKFELKNNEDIKNGNIKFDVTVHNDKGVKGSYSAKLYVTTPETTQLDSETSTPAYLPFKGTTLSTTNNKVLAEVDLTPLDLNGESEQSYPVSYSLSEEIKNELNKNFENGTFLEGYVVFEAQDSTLYDLSIPYMGFYSDYYAQDAVEPFVFEREEGKIYQSDLLNNLLEVTGAQKPNANFSSMIGVTTGGLNGVDMDSILTSDVDPASVYYPIQAKLIDGKYHLYAGATGVSDTLYIQQFVNRTVDTNTVELINSSGATVLTDHMFDSLFGQEDNYALYKSNATASLFSEQFIAAHRAYTIIPLKDKENNQYYPDGEYTLRFTYELTNGDTDVKEYVLHIDENAEPQEASSASFVDQDKLTLTFDQEMFKVTVGGVEATLDETSSDSSKYSYTISLKDNGLDVSDFLYVSCVGQNYVEVSGLLSETGDSILWDSNIQEGGTFSLRTSEYTETGGVGTSYSVSYYNKAGQKVALSNDAKVTLIGDYSNSEVKVFTVSGDAISDVSGVVVGDTSITIPLKDISSFVVTTTKNSGTNTTDPSGSQDPNTALYITIGVVAGVVVIGCAVGLTVFFLKRKHKEVTK